MCGINGVIQFRQKFSKEKMTYLVHDMNEKIIHRGPDANGIFADENCALGMRRLSIIDIQGGIQPIWNESHDKLIVFNGEIYNYKILRKQLEDKGHIFSTDSDTEIVLHGFEDCGIAFLKQMEGMFAFAIYDTLLKKWTIARDRVGEKPLYYFKSKELFIFASELKSILSTEIVKREIDMEAMSIYFQLTYIPAPKTIIKDVFKLPPATAIIIDSNGNIYEEKYWELDIDYEDTEYQDYNICKKKLREVLFTSVEQRMISDVPLGAFLSGGFDSSIIVGIMAQISKDPVDTFTIGFKEKKYDESPLAKLVAEKHKTNHHVLMLDWDMVYEDLEKILDNMDEPFADSSLIATYAVSKMTRKYVTVALTGDAGDELFAGYDKYLISYYGELYKRVPKIIRKMFIEPGIKVLPVDSNLSRKTYKVMNAANLDIYQQRKQLMCLGFKDTELKQLMKKGIVDPMSFIEDEYKYLKHRDEQLRTQYVDLNIVLEGDMLAKVDRASMLASLETRVPLLDSRVIELAFKMPTEFKINKKDRKIIWKDTFKDLLPEELFHAPKHGFRVPIGKWLETSLKEQLYKYINLDFINEQRLFSGEYMRQLVDKHMNHKENRCSELWTLFVFQWWYKKNIMD
ncbi:MAG: asparagine synthase (glutamine-hydrolyzing) [Lachnospiraceae bacterium]|jgi:asparagine synthase (glutamine-hydrolysing)|nr:asparagine synthase (glutamine-hydrolyzing) [Lachnospiraceae bacterium]